MASLTESFSDFSIDEIPVVHPEFWSQFDFAPIFSEFRNYEVYDFTQSYDPNRTRQSPYGVGRYNELRPSMYTQGMYSKGNPDDVRNIHMGLDLAAPEATPLYAFCDGKICLKQNNKQNGDYGPTLITEHRLDTQTLYVLWGHLSIESLELRNVGENFKKGDVLGWIGSHDVNGGWNPHLHLQLSWLKPKVADLPGVVSKKDHELAVKIFPDPQWITGFLYQ